MYQHHVQLKTAEQLDSQQALQWYDVVREYGPDGVVYSYVHNGKEVAMEYGVCAECELQHTYVVPLTRDLTPTEAEFIVSAWEYLFDQDFDVEISNQYQVGMQIENDDLDIESDLREQAARDLAKWHHNRWVDAKLSEGWRAGAYFNSREKTHPALHNWDNLPESHRRAPDFSNQEILEWLNKNRAI
jgi:hypothetical protein